jgi:hypothetical protein
MLTNQSVKPERGLSKAVGAVKVSTLTASVLDPTLTTESDTAPASENKSFKKYPATYLPQNQVREE